MRNGLKPKNPISKNLSFPAIHRLGADDLERCAELSVDRGWWPERDKWSLLLAASEVYGVDAPDGRGLAGTVVLTRWGPGHAAIGMLLVASRYARRGLGRALMEHALRAAGDDTSISLFATSAGKSLYEKLGFKPVRGSVAFRGRLRADPGAGGGKENEAPAGTAGSSGNIRVATEADLPAILALDRAAYGADRERILTRMPAFAERIVVLEASDGIAGYAAAWRAEAWTVVGPLMAPGGTAARRLVMELAAHSAVPVRLDLDPNRPELPGWARACGLKPSERTVAMTRGDVPPRGMSGRLFAPISAAMA